VVKVVAFGTIAKMVIAIVALIFNGSIEKVARFLDLVTNFGKVNQPKGRSVFVD
jgi:hypothetical protein